MVQLLAFLQNTETDRWTFFNFVQQVQEIKRKRRRKEGVMSETIKEEMNREREREREWERKERREKKDGHPR